MTALPTATPDASTLAVTRVRSEALTDATADRPTPRPAPPKDDGSGQSRLYDRGPGTRREIALTFDAGEDRGHAPEILDILDGYGIKASFGITGKWAQANPDLVKRMVADGQMVFNHTWDHTSFTGASTGAEPLTRDERLAEIDKTERFIHDLTGYDTKPYFRPPYGDDDDATTLQDVAAAGYTVSVGWSCDSLGWDGASAAEIVARCSDHPSPGDIILMHVGTGVADAAALPDLIDALSTQGFTFVTVEQLLQP